MYRRHGITRGDIFPWFHRRGCQDVDIRIRVRVRVKVVIRIPVRVTLRVILRVRVICEVRQSGGRRQGMFRLMSIRRVKDVEAALEMSEGESSS